MLTAHLGLGEEPNPFRDAGLLSSEASRMDGSLHKGIRFPIRLVAARRNFPIDQSLTQKK
jgi:hypothetical protein